jgi:NAD-dependent DNA ligase
MSTQLGDEFYNRVGNDRIESRQIDELIGMARGILADNEINELEVKFLQKWLAANVEISHQPVIRLLLRTVNEVLADGVVEVDEKAELLETLNHLSNRDFELGEVLKSTTLPLDSPAPDLLFSKKRYCFTGTFNFGCRKDCEKAVIELGADVGSLTQKTNILVVGTYATESWKHSSFGNKIMKACEWRDEGLPISIVAERHWANYLPK